MKSFRKSSLQKYFLALVIAVGIFLIPHKTFANTYTFTYTSNNGVKVDTSVSTTGTTADITLSSTNESTYAYSFNFTVYGAKKGDGSSAVYSDQKITQDLVANHTHDTKKVSIKNLTIGKDYYFVIKNKAASKRNETRN